MKVQKWNDGWKFWVDRDSFALVWNVPEKARDVEIPHDAMIEKPAHKDSQNGGNTGFRDGDSYTYVKMLYAPDEYRKKALLLKFEGVYMNALVYVNGQLAAKSPFGYSTFYAPLNDFLKYGQENEIRVQVRAGAMTNSRWYSGAGIYRDVYLLEGGELYIEPEGVQIKTEKADEEYAVLKVQTELTNRTAVPQALMAVTVITDVNGSTAAQECTRVVLSGQEQRTIMQRILVPQPDLWSAESPQLYTCDVKLYTEEGEECKLADESITKFGIRTIQVDAKRGLQVNQQSVKLRGGCIHHDSGLLGAATYEDAQYRQIRKMKNAGFNAVRMSHHPMAPAMLRACDEIGMYVMDETFDMWNRLKSGYDYGLYFREWWETDVTAMVRKDYNHPSVLLYSVGNEIPEIGTDQGAKTCHELCEKIRSLDDTRFTLASINGVFAAGDAVDQIVADVAADLKKAGKISGNVNDFMTLMDDHMDEIVVHDAITDRLEKACASVDIAGYNYMTARYERDGNAYPNRVIVGSETYPPDIARNWDLVEKLPHVIGDFTWTGWDYIGEAGVGIPAYKWGEGGFGAAFPAQLAYPGDFDLTGYRRPASYYREIVFGLRTEPYIAVQNLRHYGEPLIKTPWVISDASADWNWDGMEGEPAVVEVYAPGEEVELYLNGNLVGRKPSGKAAGFRTLFETVYEPGTLMAVAYAQGQEISRWELKTAEKKRSLHVEKEVDEGLRASAQQLIYVQVEVRDQQGVLAADDHQKITLTVDGDAEVAGFGSGNPKPVYNFNEGVTELFKGRAQIILKKTSDTKPTRIVVTAENGMQGELVL